MREYPSIGGANTGHKGEPCFIFEKYDGSNLRCEWNKKSGWSKFGSRTRRFDKTDNQFGDAVDLFAAITPDVFERIAHIIKRKNYRKATIFCEYLGDNSFAGTHFPEDKKRLVLFDVTFNGMLLPPREFLDMFRDAPYRAHCYGTDTYNQNLINSVKEGKLTSGEGVICKGYKQKGGIWMAKIKTDAYIKRLQEMYKNSWEDYV